MLCKERKLSAWYDQKKKKKAFEGEEDDKSHKQCQRICMKVHTS